MTLNRLGLSGSLTSFWHPTGCLNVAKVPELEETMKQKRLAWITERNYAQMDIVARQVPVIREFTWNGREFFIYRSNGILYLGEPTTGMHIVRSGNAFDGHRLQKTISSFVAMLPTILDKLEPKMDLAIRNGLANGFNVAELIKEVKP